MRLHRHARKRGQRQQDAPLPLIDRCHRLGDQHVGRDVACPRIERRAPIAKEAGGLQDAKRMALQGRTESCGCRPFAVVERAPDLPFEQHDGIVDRQTVQGQVVHLAAQAWPARRNDEPGPRGGVDELFQILPVQPNVVDEDQRPPVLKRAADLCRGRLADLVALVVRVEDLLLHVRGRLLTGGEVDDAVGEGGGRRMICGGSKEGRLADAGVAPDLDGKSAVERREISANSACRPNRPRIDRGRRSTGVERGCAWMRREGGASHTSAPCGPPICRTYRPTAT